VATQENRTKEEEEREAKNDWVGRASTKGNQCPALGEEEKRAEISMGSREGRGRSRWRARSVVVVTDADRAQTVQGKGEKI
jgi:hypothetical protein